MSKMTMTEIEARKAEIAELLNAEDADLDALNTEVDELNARAAEITAECEKRDALLASIAKNERGKEITTMETPAIVKTNEEIRNSQEYINAFANYIKSGEDKECRALLTENVASGTVPVPAFVYDIVKRAWEDEQIMQLVSKSAMPGNVKVGFEISGTDAVVHTEGDTAPSEETLTLGIVTLVPASIKKWITISDEAYDLGGEAFLRYVYEELAHKIAKKAADELVALIDAAPATSTATAAAVGALSQDMALGTVIDLVALLSDEARDITLVMNKGTWAAFRALAITANYPIDIFDGHRVVFNNTLKSFADASSGDTYLIAGDFGYGALANFPNGDGINIKFDDLSLAESDLVKIVGREYVGMGVVAPYAFAKAKKK